MIIARIGKGKVRHVVEFRPDKDLCWHSLCHMVTGGSESLDLSSTYRGCLLCIATLEDRLARLKERI